MMKERQIRTIIPFVIVFLSTFFLSEAELLHNFGTRWDMVQHNARLVWLLFTGDLGQAAVWFLCSLIFYKAWRKNRLRGVWYTDIHWQLSGIFLCWSVLSLLSLVSNFYSYLWLTGMVRLFVFVFGFYCLNTLFAARKMLFHPETPEEMEHKAAKFDELIKILRNERDVV